MKTLTAVLMAILLFAPMAYADLQADEEAVAAAEAEKPSAPEPFLCPVSKISNNDKCMSCHKLVLKDGRPAFGIREVLIDSNYDEKPYAIEIYQEGDQIVAYYVLSSISPDVIDKIRRYLLAHPEIKELTIEVHSPGGSVMDAWRIVGLLDDIKRSGVHVTTICNGLAASAGAILLIAGDSRFVSPTAEILIHKVWQFSMFDIATPDSAEDKADTLRHFQKNINDYIASRTKITAEEINNKTYHKDWWLTGKEAVELGIAHGFIGE